MIDLKAKVDDVLARRYLDNVQRNQIPFATALALTRTAKSVDMALRSDLAARLQSASPYTLRSTYSTSATKQNLTAIIGIKDKKPSAGTAPAMLLKEHFTGGARGNKPMEAALIALGVLPKGWRVVPGAGMPVDAYGNPKRAAVKELLGALRSKAQIYKGRGKRVALIGYFAIVPGVQSHLPPGIYWRNGRAIRPMLLFIKRAAYHRIFDLPKLAQKVVDREFITAFGNALDTALATAR